VVKNACKGPVVLPQEGPRTDMEDELAVTCPYCGETVEVAIDPDGIDARRGVVQDCEVCCNPWRLRFVGRGRARYLEVRKADGSE